MGQDFYRTVTGYNRPFYGLGIATLSRNSTLTLNFPAGPGKIEKVMIMINQTTNENLKADLFTLTLDGSNVFASAGHILFMIYDQVPFWGPISSYQRGTVYTVVQLLVDWDYMSSGSLKVQNVNSPDPSIYYLTVWGRVGL